MRVAYFDCPSGAAGDMILGALVDAGAPFEALERALATLGVSGYSLERQEVKKGAFRATKVDVRLPQQESSSHEPHHRHLATILGIIDGSGLPEAVKAQASRIFMRLAEAEARAHGMGVEQVHFHDVGAVDAIVDVTGACMGLHLLGIEQVHCSALPVGGGTIVGPHGRMPIPAPGTVELLRGFPVIDTGVQRELLTPTGAAILTTLSVSAGPMPSMRLIEVGYGAGTWDLETPNVVRLLVGEVDETPAAEAIAQVETTVDDMSPQLYEPLIDRLLEAGALDVHLIPTIMKRSRPGTTLVALCQPSAVPAISRILFEESTTIGVRWTTYQRQRLDREIVTLETVHGPIAFKVSRLGGRVMTVTPEFADLRRIAQERGLPVREVLEQARAEGRRLHGA